LPTRFHTSAAGRLTAISRGIEAYVGAATATDAAGAGVCAVAAPAMQVTASAHRAEVIPILRIHFSMPPSGVAIRRRPGESLAFQIAEFRFQIEFQIGPQIRLISDAIGNLKCPKPEI
jgi:hypothetical protein